MPISALKKKKWGRCSLICVNLFQQWKSLGILGCNISSYLYLFFLVFSPRFLLIFSPPSRHGAHGSLLTPHDGWRALPLALPRPQVSTTLLISSSFSFLLPPFSSFSVYFLSPSPAPSPGFPQGGFGGPRFVLSSLRFLVGSPFWFCLNLYKQSQKGAAD